ncbi:PIG-L family deacetylase [Peribacillus sp. NJ4]|uniref:PIG-L family deacetylase n=1 Tax=unclassified Peribacillus TaxID=2675266 RepID=UPI0025A0A39C|nr:MULTISPECIES: PIG-L family deacetylase [unclassified Peribacillus]MDM5212913.1 PIG-L family deacetylase [Peribacillus sp. NJ4]MDM5223305.1 PIG-L family deacetylase [Peribacillus sp. NJ11]
MQSQQRLLVVLAHPDDESFLCGGTIAKMSEQGVHITLLCATKGEMGRRMGNPILATRESLPGLRVKELNSACEELGINDLRFLHVRDKTIEFESIDLLAERIVKVIREVRPDALVTFHEKYGGHPDHCAIGRAAELAFLKSGDPGFYPDPVFPAIKVHSLYFVLWHAFHEKWLKENGLSSITRVNIAGTLQKKIRALRSHRSQTLAVPELWGNQIPSLPFLKKFEYFIKGNSPNDMEDNDLFQTIERMR